MRYSRYEFDARNGGVVDIAYSCYRHDEATGKFTYIRLPWIKPTEFNKNTGGKFSSKPIDDPDWYWTVVKKHGDSTWYTQLAPGRHPENEIRYTTVFIPETHPMYNINILRKPFHKDETHSNTILTSISFMRKQLQDLYYSLIGKFLNMKVIQ
jgi:hypothetical protein